MLIFAVGAGVAAFWFWFLAPEHLNDRVRHIGGALAMLVCVTSMWLTVHMSNQMLEAARRASAEADRREADKYRMIRQLRGDEERALGFPYAPDSSDRIEREGFRGGITN